MTFLLDTNVVSEWVKPRPDPGVIAWLTSADEDSVFISVVTIGELRHGIERLASGRRRDRLDEWLRHRLRAIQLKHWKRGTTMYRELLNLGAPRSVARTIAANSRRWWCNSAKLLNSVLTIAYFDRLGVPRLS